MAPFDRPRLVLEPAAHGDLRLRRARGTVVGVSHSHDDVRRARAASSGERSHLGAPRTARRLHLAPGAGSRCSSSAPFDDWWHNAYGLDVRIISPPHMVLAAGFFGINFGTVMLMLAFVNRAGEAARRPLQRLLLYVGGMAVCESLLLKLEYISRAEMHSASFYTVAVFGTLGIVMALGVASRHRWGCTILTAVYTDVRTGVSVDPAAVSRGAEAGTGLSPGDPFHPVGIPAARDYPGARDRSDPSAHRRVASDRPGARHGCSPFSARSSRCSGRSRSS